MSLQNTMNLLKSLLRDAVRIGYIWWILLFILINIVFRTAGGTNEMSRYATMRAMTDQQTFKIDNYLDWTIDWGQNTSQEKFSNKAPGPMLIGFPIFFVADKITSLSKKTKFTDIGGQKIRQQRPGPTTRSLTVLFSQVIPFAILLLIAGNLLFAYTQSIIATNLAICLMAFGNTAVIFMNNFMGHGMTSYFVLGLSIAILKRNYSWIGFCFGFALLSEYTAGLLLFPLLVLLLVQNKRDFTWIKPFVIGGILPGILWCWYHISTMGSPFSIPAFLQNPMWIEEAAKEEKLFGMFSKSFHLEVLYELLFGFKRGIIVTQPWVFVTFGIILLKWKELNSNVKNAVFFCFSSLFILLLVNSSFNGWHGGATSGPRYLSMVFPSLALVLGILYKSSHKFLQALILLSGLVAVTLRVLILGAHNLASESQNLWPNLYDYVLLSNTTNPTWRMVFLSLSLSLISLFLIRKTYLQKKNGQ